MLLSIKVIRIIRKIVSPRICRLEFLMIMIMCINQDSKLQLNPLTFIALYLVNKVFLGLFICLYYRHPIIDTNICKFSVNYNMINLFNYTPYIQKINFGYKWFTISYNLFKDLNLNLNNYYSILIVINLLTYCLSNLSNIELLFYTMMLVNN